MDKSARMKELVEILNKASKAYYAKDEEIMSNFEYDKLYDELEKIEKAGWHVTKSEFVNAPLFDELPMALECKLISYDEETCRLVGEIINVCADERILDENGKIDLNKFSPITYDPVHHGYVELGKRVGNAFADGKELK